MKPFVAVCGHTNLDVHLQVPELPRPGQSSPVLERRIEWGGTAANIARHAGSLGVGVRLWSRVGKDFPAEWRQALQDDGVLLEHLEVDALRLTPTCYIATDSLDRQQFFMDQGAMVDLAQNPAPLSLLDGIQWLHVATGDPLGYAQVADAAKRAGIRVAFDPGQELRFQYDARSLQGMLELADVFWCNDQELEVACVLLDVASPDALLKFVPSVVVTRGARGLSWYARNQAPTHAPAFPVGRVLDPTGAGDACRAGFYAATAKGLAFEEALRWGQAAASLVVETVGGQSHPVTPAALAERLRLA